MVDASCGGIFLYKTPKEAWGMFENLSENSHLHSIFSRSDLPGQLGSKGGIYEVSHLVDLSTISKKFDQLLCMNKVSNVSSMEDVCSICISSMYAFVNHSCVDKSDCVIEQANAT